LPRPPGFVLRSDSGVADLTRTFGSGVGLSALSQRLRSRRCAALYIEISTMWSS